MQEDKKEELNENLEEDIKQKKDKQQDNIDENKKTKEEVLKEPTLEERNALLTKEVNDWKREYAIKLADFENYKKRKDKELQEYKKYACESLIVKQLESLDVLSMAIESAKSNHDIDSLLEGLEMIRKGMINYLTDEGLTEIEAENEKYDPYLHHAVQTINDENIDNEKVVQVLQKGYKLKNKVIRPAMVTINKK